MYAAGAKLAANTEVCPAQFKVRDMLPRFCYRFFSTTVPFLLHCSFRDISRTLHRDIAFPGRVPFLRRRRVGVKTCHSTF